MDPKLLASVINTSSGRCWSSEVYNPVPDVLENVPSSNNYQVSIHIYCDSNKLKELYITYKY